MPRDQHDAHNWPEYQEYGSHGEYDYTRRSTSGPAPADYLSTFDHATSRRPDPRAKRLTWMLIGLVGGALLLAIGIIGCVASRLPGRQLTPPHIVQASRSPLFPTKPSLPVRPEEHRAENLMVDTYASDSFNTL